MAARKIVDPRGAHARLYWDMIDSPAWSALSFSQQALYVACRRLLTSNNNGNLHFSLKRMSEYGFVSPSTLANGLRGLIATGFIAVTREGGNVRRGQAIPTLYRFTDYPCHEWRKLGIPMQSATNEWRQFQSNEQAQKAIESAEARASAAHAERKAGQRQKKNADTEFGS
jgi:hypothetical protein